MKGRHKKCDGTKALSDARTQRQRIRCSDTHIILNEKVVLILFALFIRNSCWSIDFHSFGRFKRISLHFILPFFWFVFNHFKSVWVILFIFCRYDKSLCHICFVLFAVVFCLFYVGTYFLLFLLFTFLFCSPFVWYFVGLAFILLRTTPSNDPLSFYFHIETHTLHIYIFISDNCVRSSPHTHTLSRSLLLLIYVFLRR